VPDGLARFGQVPGAPRDGVPPIDLEAARAGGRM